MQTVRDACQLQSNALSIKLSDQIEQLDELLTAEGDGTQFFEKTYITQGMQDLISEGMARLAGVSTQGIFHLKQAMGGGKTHLLPGFGLLAKHPILRQKYCGGLPYAQTFEVADIAAFNGRNHPDHFFWGEIANQLGKGEQFKTFWTIGPKAPDEKDWLKLFDGGTPILILLDEMPPYFHYLDTQKIGNGTVADIATRAFANLITAAGKKSNVCVVVSDLAASYDTGTGLINRALEDARAELGRQERNITPVDLAANEIYDILRKRLLTSLPDKAAISDIAASYGRKLEEASKSKVASLGAEAIADDIAATYPFHPRLQNVVALFKENEQFKQTRGLIELVSRLLRSVWEYQANDVFLIGPQHFDLGIQEVRDKLTEISGMRDVIARDIWDGNAAALKLGVSQAANWHSKLSTWDGSPGVDTTHQTFYNQAINTLYTYGTRATVALTKPVAPDYKHFPMDESRLRVGCHPSDAAVGQCDVFITDPPYGDAIKYEEILDFFIAWLRKNPPPEFADWVWDSRRSLAIKGEDEDFRRCMVVAYKRMTECMPDNGIQIRMFTHQNGSIWGDMANIVWASGLQVTAAWYVATETDSVLRAGTHVKGTVLLVCRKRQGSLQTTRDDLAWALQEEVEAQVQALTGLNQEAKGLYRDENVFEDADLQMAGYAAALCVLTRYAIIDGRDMTTEAIRPRVRGETTFVDVLIAFAVDTANQCLIPSGIAKTHWDGLNGAERFYLKLMDLEARGFKTLDNYQNFAKAFKVRDFRALMASQRANQARLKSAVEFGQTEMSDSSELHRSVLRAVLYAMMELVKNVDSDEVLAHLRLNVPDYYANQTQRDLVVELADYLARTLETHRPDEASAARILRELVKNQRLG